MFHRHKWEAVQASIIEPEFTPCDAATAILYQCRCKRVKTSTIKGHWTLEQVRGEAQSEQPAV